MSFHRLHLLRPVQRLQSSISISNNSLLWRGFHRTFLTNHESKLFTSNSPQERITKDHSNSVPTVTEPATHTLSEEVRPRFSAAEANSISTVDPAHVLGKEAFRKEEIDTLMAPIPEKDIEIKPDGVIYLPEIKYRRILNKSFGPGAWALLPRGPHSMAGNVITREYALFVRGNYIAQARGEQEVFQEKYLATAMEGCKSNALTRCCKDLGIASELWDPNFIREYRRKQMEQVWVKHLTKFSKQKIWKKRGAPVDYPYAEIN